MDVRRLMVASVAVKGIYRRYAQLSNGDKDKVKAKVKEKLNGKANGNGAKSEKLSDEEIAALDGKAPEKEEKSEEPEAESGDEQGGEEAAPEGGLESIVEGLRQEVETIQKDGKVDPGEVLGLFDNLMQMVTLLVGTRPPAKPRKKA